ncbi:MAG: hypothetical protein QGG48_10915, partial [Desulfatiglandales bacterium]|nr:hypothetical protein [Desulfatiglandales bacterium]
MNQEAHESRTVVEKVIAIALPLVALAMTVYHLAYTQYLLQGPTGHRITHLAFAFVVVILTLILQSRKARILKWSLLIASLVVSVYLMYYLMEIMTFRQTIPIPSDLVIGFIVILTTF